MVCLTDRSVLPALIFYDMHAVLRRPRSGGGRGGTARGAAER